MPRRAESGSARHASIRCGCALLVLLALLPRVAHAQHAPRAASPVHAARAQSPHSRSAGALDEPHQIALDVGWLSLGVSYARRAGGSPWSFGGGIWGSWEPPNSLVRTVFEPIGVSAFARYRAAPWLHADVGPTLARYLWADDCSDCTGTIVGVRALAFVGHRFVYAGPEITVGRVSDDRNGTEAGILWGAHLRIVLGWGP